MPGWETRAACKGMDPELFFPLGPPPDSTLAVCRSLCRVRGECLDEALTQGHHGIWGGTTSGDRRSMRRSVLLTLTSRATPEVTPMPELQTNAAEITQALLDGRTVKDVAVAYDVPRQQITALINRTDGWSLDARTDTVLIGSAHGETPVDLTGHDEHQDDEDPDGDDGQDELGDVDLSAPEVLLARAEGSDVAATRAAAAKVRSAIEDLRDRIGDLRDRVEKEAAEKRTLDEIAELEAQIAAKRAALKDIRPSKAAGRRTTGTGPTPKEIRAWAAEHGIECSPRGRVPQEIVEKYLAAKAGS